MAYFISGVCTEITSTSRRENDDGEVSDLWAALSSCKQTLNLWPPGKRRSQCRALGNRFHLGLIELESVPLGSAATLYLPFVCALKSRLQKKTIFVKICWSFLYCTETVSLCFHPSSASAVCEFSSQLSVDRGASCCEAAWGAFHMRLVHWKCIILQHSVGILMEVLNVVYLEAWWMFSLFASPLTVENNARKSVKLSSSKARGCLLSCLATLRPAAGSSQALPHSRLIYCRCIIFSQIWPPASLCWC